VPAPAAAGLALLPLCGAFEFGPEFFRSPWLNAVTLIGISLLMISRVPTYSFKRVRVPHAWVLPLMVTAALFAAFLATAPWPTLVVVGLIYVGSIPFSILSYARLKKAAEEIRATAGLRAVETLPTGNATDAAQ
jgi:CDP-diacylglycerol--serine O-phosphatidyltransferase